MICDEHMRFDLRFAVFVIVIRPKGICDNFLFAFLFAFPFCFLLFC